MTSSLDWFVIQLGLQFLAVRHFPYSFVEILVNNILSLSPEYHRVIILRVDASYSPDSEETSFCADIPQVSSIESV